MSRFGTIAGACLAGTLLGIGCVGKTAAEPALPASLELDDPREAPLGLHQGGPRLVQPHPVIPRRADAAPDADAWRQRIARLGHWLQDQPPARPGEAGLPLDASSLSESLDSWLSRYEAEARLSVHVRDLRTHAVLFDHDGAEPLIPASNQKLVTAAAALDLLGPDYTFATTVTVDERTLYIRGEGDPSLDADDLDAIAQLVASKVDVASLDRIVVDDSAFSQRRFGPGYDPEGIGYAYTAPSGALSVDFNTVEVSVSPVPGQRPLGIEVWPPSDHIVIDNNTRVGKRRSVRISTHARNGKTVVRVDGSMPRRGRAEVERRRVIDPALHTGGAFARILAEHSASKPLPVSRGEAPAGARELVVNESEPLLDVLDQGLAYSNNFIAEQVLRTTAWQLTGEPGDWDAGQDILEEYWDTVVGDEGFVATNGSGLTRQGRATAEGLVDLLAVAHRVSDHEESLLEALPVAGEPGTLKNRLTRSGRRVRAKTGTLSGVSGLSGVIVGNDERPQVAFSILINVEAPARLVAKERRAIEDGIVLEVLEALDQHAADRGPA